jgi:cytochrome oxidase assembly protein ShyY1
VPRRRLPLSPAWIAGHLLVLVVAGVCVNLGLWQLGRLHDRRTENARIKSRIGAPAPLPESGWSGSGSGAAAADELAYWGVSVSGTYDTAHDVLVRYRSHEGLPGYEVVTPLVTDDGGAVLVDRGWVPLDLGEHWPAPSASAPTGTVTVTGWLTPPHSSRVAPVAPAGGKPAFVSDVDPAQLRPLLPYGRLYALAIAADGTDTRFPAPVGLPDLSEGPHLSYAFQWFSFAAIGLIGWTALVATRRR